MVGCSKEELIPQETQASEFGKGNYLTPANSFGLIPEPLDFDNPSGFSSAPFSISFSQLASPLDELSVRSETGLQLDICNYEETDEVTNVVGAVIWYVRESCGNNGPCENGFGPEKYIYYPSGQLNPLGGDENTVLDLAYIYQENGLIDLQISVDVVWKNADGSKICKETRNPDPLRDISFTLLANGEIVNSHGLDIETDVILPDVTINSGGGLSTFAQIGPLQQ